MTRPFFLGKIVITKVASETLDPEDVLNSLKRHAQCDWGDLCSEDIAENEFALENDLRLLSAYQDRHGTKLWIITEANRTCTTILLPEDY